MLEKPESELVVETYPAKVVLEIVAPWHGEDVGCARYCEHHGSSTCPYFKGISPTLGECTSFKIAATTFGEANDLLTSQLQALAAD